MAANTYIIGNGVKLLCTFRDYAAALADPAAVTCKIKQPDETVVQYDYGTDAELVRDSLGIYYVEFLPSQSGAYCWRFEGTGNVTCAEEAHFTISAGCFA
jgi:hypothetical protein